MPALFCTYLSQSMYVESHFSHFVLVALYYILNVCSAGMSMQLSQQISHDIRFLNNNIGIYILIEQNKMHL